MAGGVLDQYPGHRRGAGSRASLAADTPPSPGTDDVDLVSDPLAGVGVGALVLGIVQGETWGWASAAVIGSFALGLVLVAAFAVRSSRHPAPLFDLELYRLRSYSVANIASVFFASAAFVWLVPLHTQIQSVRGWSVLTTGLRSHRGR